MCPTAPERWWHTSCCRSWVSTAPHGCAMEGCGEQGGLHSRTLRSFPCREALHGAAPHAEGAGGRAGGDLLLQSLGDTRAQEVLLVSGCGQRGRGAPAASPLTASLPCRYHNGTLLDRTAHRYSSRLVLRALTPEQAGSYHCKASTEAGAIRSAPAQLTVLGERGWDLCGAGTRCWEHGICMG